MKKVDLLKKQLDTLRKKVADGEVLSAKELRSYARLEADLADAKQEDVVFRSSADVAEYSGYAKRTVRDAVSKGHLPRQPDKTYLQSDVDTWLAARGKKPKKCSSDGDSKTSGQQELWDRSKEEANYRHWRAVREKLLVKSLQGELLPRDEVYRLFVTRAHEYKTSLLLLSRRIGHKIAAESGMESTEVNKIIDAEVVDLLSQMARPFDIEG